MRRLSLKALIVGTIVVFVAVTAISLIIMSIIGSTSDTVLYYLGIVIDAVGIFIGAVIAGRLAPKAGSFNGSAVAISAWVISVVLLFAMGGSESALATIQDWYWIFLFVAVGGLGGNLGTHWAERNTTKTENPP